MCRTFLSRCDICRVAHDWLCCTSTWGSSHIHRSYSLSMKAVACKFQLPLQNPNRVSTDCTVHWPSLTETRRPLTPTSLLLHREKLTRDPEKAGMSLLWPAVWSLKRLREAHGNLGKMLVTGLMSTWSLEHISLVGSCIQADNPPPPPPPLSFYLLGHVSLSSASQRHAEARVVDPAKTCPWRRCQDRALKNKGSVVDKWLPLKESRGLWLQWAVGTSGGWKPGLANWIPACLGCIQTWHMCRMNEGWMQDAVGLPLSGVAFPRSPAKRWRRGLSHRGSWAVCCFRPGRNKETCPGFFKKKTHKFFLFSQALGR